MTRIATLAIAAFALATTASALDAMPEWGSDLKRGDDSELALKIGDDDQLKRGDDSQLALKIGGDDQLKRGDDGDSLKRGDDGHLA